MFQLENSTKVTCTAANVRCELHGEEMVRAIDLKFRLKGENHLLDLIQPGLREHYYCNKEVEEAVRAGQQPLMPDEVIPLPNLRYPLLPTENQRWGDKRYRGYRWIWDYGIEGEHFDFTDVVVGSIVIEELQEGGSVSIAFTLQYNGEELNENEVYGELAGLPCLGSIFIKLLAPPELIAVRKGYRAGRADTPQQQLKDPRQQGLDDSDDHGDDEDSAVDDALAEAGLAAGSPEAALAATLPQHDEETDCGRGG